MKIAVITLHRVFNYGSVLQAYATQRILSEKGCSVEIIDYVSEKRTLTNIFSQVPTDLNGKAIRVIYKLAKLGSLLLKQMTFGRFVKRNLKLTKKYITFDDLVSDPPKADAYVTGSDQVWNSYYNGGVDRAFFLDFVPESSRRLAYAASFGKDRLDENEISETAVLISRYAAISVREAGAVDILRSLNYEDAVCLIDPTLQVRSVYWQSIMSRRLIGGRYVILMLLYNEDNHATEYARSVADKLGYKLVKLSWDFKKDSRVDKLMTHRSPADFLSLFYYADFVVTNSFHGLAFSIAFNKRFIVVPRNAFNSRIANLLQLTGLEERLADSEDKVLAVYGKPIAYEAVNAVLDEERLKADCFLTKALGGRLQ